VLSITRFDAQGAEFVFIKPFFIELVFTQLVFTQLDFTQLVFGESSPSSSSPSSSLSGLIEVASVARNSRQNGEKSKAPKVTLIQKSPTWTKLVIQIDFLPVVLETLESVQIFSITTFHQSNHFCRTYSFQGPC